MLMDELEQKLVEYNWISNEQLRLVKQQALAGGKSVWNTLVRLGYMSEEDIAVFFAHESGISYVKVSDYKINEEIIRLFNEDYCRQNSVIPLFKIKDTLFVASSNPFDAALLDALTKISGCPVELLLASDRLIREALDSYWGLEDKVFDSAKFIFKQTPMQGVGFWRESERLPLNIPVTIKTEDKSIALCYGSSMEGYTHDISHSGTAIGLQVLVFLPKGINISLELSPGGSLSNVCPILKVKGEIVYCRMEKGQHYFLGIKFTEISEEIRSQLIELARRK